MPENRLLPPQAAYLGSAGTSADPNYSFGHVYELSPHSPPGTYTGAIPLPDPDIGPKSMELPHDYYNAVTLLKQSGQYTPQMNQLLQLMYLRQGRRA